MLILETGDEEVILHIHLDERDLRGETRHDLKSNGFTESRQVSDFPIRDRKVVLHVRQRRWIDSNGRNIVLKNYDLLAEGVSYSKEFADALKKHLDTYPVTARSLAQHYRIDGNSLKRAYKNILLAIQTGNRKTMQRCGFCFQKTWAST